MYYFDIQLVMNTSFQKRERKTRSGWIVVQMTQILGGCAAVDSRQETVVSREAGTAGEPNSRSLAEPRGARREQPDGSTDCADDADFLGDGLKPEQPNHEWTRMDANGGGN